MKKRFNHIIRLVMAVYLFQVLTPLNVFGEMVDEKKLNVSSKEINIQANSVLLMEPTTGKIIFEKNSDQKYEPASVTKIMTMLITMEKISANEIGLQDKVTVSENAKKMGGSTMLLDNGEIRTVEELLKGVAIASGNDAAVALAEYISGSEEAFVGLMNKRADALGMKNTTFKNCHGLPVDGHEMTAVDIATMSKELLRYSDILRYTGTYMETLSEGRNTPIEMVNHNKLVRFFKGCDGLKTGFTSKAKYCISATAKKDGVRMLVVIMGAPTYKQRNRDASMLMNYGFGKFQNVSVFKKGEIVEKVSLNKSGSKYIEAKAKEEFSVIIERNQKNQKIEKNIKLNLEKRNYKAGDEIGICEVLLEGKRVGELIIVTDRDFRVGGFFNEFIENIKELYDYAI